jgi:predicted transcriptional regulator
MKALDTYDLMILDIVRTHRRENQSNIRLAVLERNFWKQIETHEQPLGVGQAKIGERITFLYLNGFVHNKNGYALTKKGKAAVQMSTSDAELSTASANQMEWA